MVWPKLIYGLERANNDRRPEMGGLEQLLWVASLLSMCFGLSSTQDSRVMFGPCNGTAPCVDNSQHNLVLGGLFPIHNVVCDRDISLDGLQWVTAMDEAVKDVNARNIISSEDGSVKLSLGYEIRDTCRLDTVALQEVLSFLGQGNERCTSGGASDQGRQLVGVVGPFSSSVSIRATRLLQLFRLPMISYGSTSPQLSNMDIYPYFLRTLPSDTFLARAIVRAARQRGWTFINLIHTGDAFGRDGSQSVRNEARAAGVCIGSVTEVHVNAQYNNTEGQRDYSVAWNRLLTETPFRNSSVTVLFVQETNARHFFLFGQYNSAVREAALNRNITFLGVDSWGDILSAVQEANGDPLQVAIGAVSPIPFNKILQPFDVAFGNLQPLSLEGRKNPWLNDSWQETFSCLPSSPSDVCNNNRFTNRPGYVQSSKVAMVYDAVYAFAYALRDILRDQALCPGSPANCARLQDGSILLTALQNVNFPGVNAETFRFNRHGDPLESIYAEKNMVVNSMNAVSFPTVGIYSATETALTQTDCRELPDSLFSDNICFRVSFNGSVRQVIWNDGTNMTPISVCSQDCVVGQSRVIQQSEDSTRDLSCCWSCRNCLDSQFSNVTNADECMSCRDIEKVKRDSLLRNIACSLLPVEFYSITHPLAFIMAVVAGLTKVAVFTMLVVQLAWWEGDKYLPWPLRVLPTAVSLAGIFITLVAGQLYVVRPSPLVCSVSYSIATAGLTLALAPVILFVWEWHSANTLLFNEEFTELSTFFQQHNANPSENSSGPAALAPAVVLDEADGEQMETLADGDLETTSRRSHSHLTPSPKAATKTSGTAALQEEVRDGESAAESRATAENKREKPPANEKKLLQEWLRRMATFLLLYGILLAVSLVLKSSDVKDGIAAHTQRTLTCADSGPVLFGFAWLLFLLLVLLVSAGVAVKSIQSEDNTFEADLIKSTLFSVLICTICVVACVSVYTASPLSVIRNGAASLCLCLVSLSLIGVLHGPRFYYIFRHRSQLLHKYEEQMATMDNRSETTFQQVNATSKLASPGDVAAQ